MSAPTLASYDDLVEKLEEALKNEYSSNTIKCVNSIGASIYELAPPKKILGNAFRLIASKPKSFRVDVISTADTDFNGIKTYLDFCEFQLKEKKVFLDIEEIKNFKKNSKYAFKIKKLLVYLIIKEQDIKKVHEKVKYTASIIYTNDEYSRVILASIPLLKIDTNFLLHSFLMFKRGSTIISSVSNIIMQKTKKSFNYYSNTSPDVQTNLIFFTDITKSTKLVNEYSREGLFFVKRAMEKISQEIEREGFIINEILGDGVLYSIPLLKLSNYTDIEKRLITLNRNIFKTYNNEKDELLQLIKKTSSEEDKYVYETIEKILSVTFLKTSIAIDGTYFMPFDSLSYNRSIMYGKNLWNMGEIFEKYENEKNKSDVFIYNNTVERYLKIFCQSDFNNIANELRNDGVVCIKD